MLTKSPNAAASTSADAKTKHARKADEADQPKRAVSLTAVIHEPKVDWVPLAWAPLRYTSHGYIRSAEKWAENLSAKVAQFATLISSRYDFPTPEYSFQSKKKWHAEITAVGTTTIFAANGGQVWLWKDSILVGGDPDDLLSDEVWKEFLPGQKSAARWLKYVLREVLNSLREDFREALITGSAHIMARESTVLAPFERVAPDQWQYFKLDEPGAAVTSWEMQYSDFIKPDPLILPWFDPRKCGWELSTATGPSGEKLYAIHVAPGVHRIESGPTTPEEKCTQWLVESMTAFPERSPKPRAALLEQALSMFPGLSKRGFDRCFSSAQRQTRNFNWSSPGAPPKSPR